MTKSRYQPHFMGLVHRAAAQKKFTVGSTFSGAGGSSMGYMLAGGHIAFAIEIDPEAVRTYRRNFPGTWVEQRDFREIAASPEVITRFLARAGVRPGELDILDNSPPCNEICKLGPGPQPGGTSRMIVDVARFARVALPRVIIIENVPQLAGKHRQILEEAVRLLRWDNEMGVLYQVEWRILTASDYGVAQKRERMILIAVRADVGHVAGINLDEHVRQLFPAPTHAVPITFTEALAEVVQSEAQIHQYRRAMMTSNFLHHARKLPHEPTRWMTSRKAGLGKSRCTAVRAASDLPSPTLTASGQQPDGRSGVILPFENRKLTIPEMLRVSGWPDDFVFTGTTSQAAIRIGMSVPPLMIRAIAERIYDLVLRPYHEIIRAR